jgi:hypothetical protein
MVMTVGRRGRVFGFGGAVSFCVLLALGACSDDSGAPGGDAGAADRGVVDLAWTEASAADGPAVKPDGTPTPSDGPAGPDSAQPTGPLDDEFGGASLDPSWNTLNASIFTHAVTGGELVLTPTAWSMWYEGDQGPGVYKLIDGNFKVSTLVRVRQASKPGKPPSSDYQFGGLMARDPASDGVKGENYVFIVLGYRGDYLASEAKTTVDDSSTITAPSWPSGDGELRICRVGKRYRVYRRPIGGSTWEQVEDYTRNDLPQKLQVTLVAYALANTPDVIARFEYYRVSTQVSTLADCTTD